MSQQSTAMMWAGGVQYIHVDIYQIEDFDPTYIQIADRGSHVRFMNYEGALTTMTKALTTRLWHQSPGIWDLKRVGPGIWDVNNVEKPWPGYASQSKGAEWTRRCGWVWHWKVLHISVFHPQENSLKSMGYQISFTLPMLVEPNQADAKLARIPVPPTALQ